jgi:signal peptidase I
MRFQVALPGRFVMHDDPRSISISEGRQVNSEQKKKSVVREYAEAIVIAILLALFIRTFVVQAFKIPSGSMLPTLQIGDHLLVNKFIYGIRMPFAGTVLVPIKEPKHGDIIVFRFPRDRSTDYIKRVVGLPGDKLEIKDKTLLINDQKIDDPHAHFTSPSVMAGDVSPKDNLGPIVVPPGKYFVMGDNRDNSSDSRFWGFVDDNDILGKAMIIYWSWDIDEPLLSWDRFSSIRWSRLADIIR